MDCLRNCNWRNHHLDTCATDECYGCRPRLADKGSVLCLQCGEKLTGNLRQIVSIWPDLQMQLGVSTEFALKERVSGSHEPGLVINESVIECEAAVRDWLLFVVRVIMTESPKHQSSGSVSRETLSLVRFLLLNQEFLLNHELAGDLVDDSSRLHYQVRAVAYPIRKDKVDVADGFCGVVVEDGELCGGQLFAVLRSDADELPPFLFCKSDKTHLLPTNQWRGTGRRIFNAMAKGR